MPIPEDAFVKTGFVKFYYNTYYGAKGIVQTIKLKDHFGKEFLDKYRAIIETEGQFIAAFKKEDSNDFSMGNLHPRGMLVKISGKGFSFDTDTLFTQKISESVNYSTALSQIYEEVEIIEVVNRSYLKYKLSPPIVSDAEKLKKLRQKLSSILERMFSRGTTLDTFYEMTSIRSDEEFINALINYSILSDFFREKHENTWILYRSYYNEKDLVTRYEYVIKLLDEYEYSKTSITIPLKSAGSLSPTEIRETDAKKYLDIIQKIELIDSKIKEELLRKVKYFSTMTESATRTAYAEYLDYIIDFPWGKTTETKSDLKLTRKLMSETVYGLHDAKQKILENLAVEIHKKGNKRGAVICLVGPPGVGKTLFATSLGEAMNRKVESIAMGGLDDVNVLRGQRRGWIGAEPGQIVKALMRAKSMNPIIVMDEIDKIVGYRGPQIQAALLEILDPNQNTKFKDAFLDFPIDLSNVFFVTTANSIKNISAALLDRLELIHLQGYSPQEKIKILHEYLLPKATKSFELKKDAVTIKQDAIQALIENNKYDLGIRGIERDVMSIYRKYLVQLVEDDLESITIDKLNLNAYVKISNDESITDFVNSKIGLINYLYVNIINEYGQGVGGMGTLQIKTVPGTGKRRLTGSIKEVFKESIEVAIGYLTTNATNYQIPAEFFRKNDFHLHAPETAVGKNGPSAGAAITTCIYSCINKLPIPQDIGMTGEIDLEGNILPVGGIQGKVTGAYQLGIRKFILPITNKIDFEKIEDEEMKKDISVKFVSHITEVFKDVFGK